MKLIEIRGAYFNVSVIKSIGWDWRPAINFANSKEIWVKVEFVEAYGRESFPVIIPNELPLEKIKSCFEVSLEKELRLAFPSINRLVEAWKDMCLVGVKKENRVPTKD
jgi:hypothetical protein